MRDELEDCSVGQAATVRETMQAIDAGSAEIALIVDGHGKLVATATDGDVRRALLAGADLDDAMLPFANTAFSAVGPSVPRAEVLDLMAARFISQVPVVGDDGRLLALHLMRELIGATPRENVAVVMAGGRGTRLHPVTKTVPKPMLEVAGRPILERLVLHLVGSGITNIYLAVNYLSHAVETHFGDGSRFGCTISYLREEGDRPLGTAGSLSLLPDAVKQAAVPLLVMNGDLVVTSPLGEILDAHEQSTAALTIAVRPYLHEVPFGVVRMHGDRVVAIDEKPQSSWEISAGMYVLSPSIVRAIPTSTPIDMPDVIQHAIARGELVEAYRIEGSWVDVGRPEELQRARGEMP